MLDLKNSAKLPSYFDYIFVHLKQKARPKFLSNFRPEPDQKSPAQLTTFVGQILRVK